MTARSSSFLCPKRPNAPTSAAAFAHRLSSQRSSPSCTIGIYPIGYRPSSSAPLQRHRPSGRIAPVSSVTELREPPRAQKCRFCARNARKWGFRRQKAHKNANFVLEMPENVGSGGQKSTKTSILCSGREVIGIGKHNRRDAYRKLGLPANHRARFKNSNTS